MFCRRPIAATNQHTNLSHVEIDIPNSDSAVIDNADFDTGSCENDNQLSIVKPARPARNRKPPDFLYLVFIDCRNQGEV